ncbi:MAG: hypothetical protein FD167_286 [bacterium]|nr:MAG: hypothetical protein FD167_286 [bacterium]
MTTATFSQAGTYVLRLSASDTALTSTDEITIIVNPAQANNTAPVVNAGQDQTITLPNGATLNGTVTDDGLPNPPAQVSVTWSKVSGSGTVTFSSPSTAVTSVTFSQAGTYVLRLSVSDSALTSTPSVATLQGQVSDDGNPNPPGQLSITWTRVDGPGTVNFTNPNAAVTQASFAIAGTYTLRLTVSDSVLSTSDDVVIIANVTSNQAPTVSAGIDQTILLPEIIILTATASDDGVPSSTLALTWSKVSGPGAVTFTDPSALSTSVVFDAAGVYRLKLTASDGQLSGSDEVEVTLNIRKQITIYSHGYGFDPEELTVKAGEKSLMIRNRTGLEVTYVFTQGSQSVSVTALPGKTAIIDATLEVGTASLTATGHSDWNCQVTIIP